MSDANEIGDKSRNMMNECYQCRHRRIVPGDAHIRCVNPDPTMTGNAHGISMGWFFYPSLFDPTWKTKDCVNYEGGQDDT